MTKSPTQTMYELNRKLAHKRRDIREYDLHAGVKGFDHGIAEYFKLQAERARWSRKGMVTK